MVESKPEIQTPPQAVKQKSVSKPTESVTPYNASVVSAGRTGASLTSTAAPISTKTENALWDEEDLMFEAVQAKGEKGYARLVRDCLKR
jgi:peptidyl-prolyl cis-trans isomerase-like protein 2